MTKTLPFLVLLCWACSSEYYTEADFTAVRKIDTHIHIYTLNSAISDQATADNFRMVNVSVDAAGNPPHPEQKRFSTYQVTNQPKQIAYVTAFSVKKWDSIGWADEVKAQLKSSFDNGALGIKIWKNIGMVEKDSSGK